MRLGNESTASQVNAIETDTVELVCLIALRIQNKMH